MPPEIVIHIFSYLVDSHDLINAYYAFLPICRILKLNNIPFHNLEECIYNSIPFNYIYVSTIKTTIRVSMPKNNVMETNHILNLTSNVIKINAFKYTKKITTQWLSGIREILLDYNTIYQFVTTTKQLDSINYELSVYANASNIAKYVHIKSHPVNKIFSNCLIELKKKLSIIDAFYITYKIFFYDFYTDDIQLYGKCYVKNDPNFETTHTCIDFDPIYLVD